MPMTEFMLHRHQSRLECNWKRQTLERAKIVAIEAVLVLKEGNVLTAL